MKRVVLFFLIGVLFLIACEETLRSRGSELPDCRYVTEGLCFDPEKRQRAVKPPAKEESEELFPLELFEPETKGI
jgi:hypothetical protein